MNHRHLIDSAIFDTRFIAGAVSLDRQREVEEFVKRDLMQVVDEVFDRIDADSGLAGQVFRIGKLEIDLGEIPVPDYRQKMVEKLREQLMLALGKLRRSLPGESPPQQARVEGIGNEQSQLYYFLRRGHLPWYSRLEDGDVLDGLLLDAIETSPAKLAAFIRENEDQAEVMARLRTQFSADAIRRVEQLLSSTGTTPADPRSVGDMQAALATALQSVDLPMVRDAWRALRVGHPEALKETLRQRGQLAMERRRMVAAISSAQFDDLLQLLESGAYRQIRSLLEAIAGIDLRDLRDALGDGLPAAGGTVEHLLTDPSRLPIQLREFALGYLLVERGDRFDEKSYRESLLRQLALYLGQRDRVGEVTRQLQRLLGGTTGRVIARQGRAGDDSQEAAERQGASRGQEKTQNRADDADRAEPYRRYARLKSALLSRGENPRVEPGLMTDLRALWQNTSWLLMRLFRELQAHGPDWGRRIDSLPVALLAELTNTFLWLASRSDALETTTSVTLPGEVKVPVATSELAAAIGSNASTMSNRQSYYAHILRCLVNGELIDFDAIDSTLKDSASGSEDTAGQSADADGYGVVSVDNERPGGDVPGALEVAPPGLLKCAELLTTASYASGISLTARQLDEFKWRFIDDYLAETGSLFNEGFFTLGYVASLVQRANIEDPREFRELLGLGLRRNSLPSTREMTRRLIDRLADDSQPAALAGAAAAEFPLRGPDAGIAAGETASAPEVSAKFAGDAGDSPEETAPLEDIHIANAGAVLLAPYLPRLFDRLGFTEDGKFTSREAAERGVHCVQYLVNESTSSPEYQLVLNKLLCGVRPGRPIRREIELSGEEIEQLESLLQAILQHWKALGNTSVAGLRESFLQRNGRLQREQDAWRLAVETRPFDMLLDQVPWSFSTIKFPWMDRVIYVEWR